MKKLLCMLMAVLICAGSASAVGALYARRAFSNDSGAPLWLENYDVSVKVTDQIAVTHVDQTFKNETTRRLEGVFVFPLPENAVITELALWINGQRVVAKVMSSDTAQADYNQIVRRSIDPALLQDMGNNIFKLSVYPIAAAGNLMCERRIEITYAELLPYDAAQVDVHVLHENGQPLSETGDPCLPHLRSDRAEQDPVPGFAVAWRHGPACHHQAYRLSLHRDVRRRERVFPERPEAGVYARRSPITR